MGYFSLIDFRISTQMPDNFNIKFMIEALYQAQKSFDADEVPVGSVVVRDSQIIGRGANDLISSFSVSGHAEINAIADASKTIQNYRLTGCDIYVTLEPCHMCAKAMVDARLKNLYFAASEPKTGAVVSVDKFFDAKHLNHKVNYSYGYMAEESADMLKKFFKSKRI